MALEYRVPAEDELRGSLDAAATAFGEHVEDENFERYRQIFPRDRVLTAFDNGTPVGLTLSVPFELTVPGDFVEAAGVTFVGVSPTHRRRGILTTLMQRQLQDVHERGEPVAILWASEPVIYGRYGYGIAAPVAAIEGERAGFALRGDDGPRGAVRLISEEEAGELFQPLYERVRRARPGMISRTDEWWKLQRLRDSEEDRRGAGPKFFLVLELDGEPAGYAMYRIRSRWERGFPHGQVLVVEVIAPTWEAERELWRFLFAIDLTDKVSLFPFDPASPLFLDVVDARRLQLTMSDGMWLRLVDVEAALRKRAFDDGEPVVLDVRDALLPLNEGSYRVGDGVARTDERPDLRLSVGDLASAYLGAFTFAELNRAGRVEELRPGALEAADRLFRTPQRPWCAEVF